MCVNGSYGCGNCGAAGACFAPSPEYPQLAAPDGRRLLAFTPVRVAA
jgi:hypothetical protein